MAEQKLGRKIRALRRQEQMTQAALAAKLGISGSYLNLIEHDKRPLSATLLLRMAELFELDLKSFAAGDDARLLEDLTEVFGDPVFENHPVLTRDVGELVAGTPEAARAIVHLYEAYRERRESAQGLAERVVDGEEGATAEPAMRSRDEVGEFMERNRNHFPELEARAERLWEEADLEVEDLFGKLADYLRDRLDVTLRIAGVDEMGGLLRRFDPGKRELTLSVVLRRGSRNFQLAHQIGLLDCGEEIDALVETPQLRSREAKRLGRVTLANYYAAAVLMPYAPFLRAAREERYDLDLLGHRFRASFEQVCHRLTTLRRRGAEGVPFHFVRVDMAGNISKVLGGSGIRFPRFSGLCPLWNVHAAFLRPGMIRVQLSQLPDGRTFFSVARTVRKHRGGYHAMNILHAIALGCEVEDAKRLVYSDGIDLKGATGAVPVGMTCRLCERPDCQARAFPPVQGALKIDENVRALSFFGSQRRP